MTRVWVCGVVLLWAVLRRGECRENVMGSEVGYLMREHSLVAPYQGTGMDIPYWEFGGSSVVTSTHVRLTPDRQSKQGNLWNTAPMRVHDWEVVIQFSVHGQGKGLFGDGFAFWYTKSRGEFGPIFGSTDYFTGLGIFFDTYSNYNGEHSHEHPYISAMINNGTLHYDHDRDGTHSQIAGCTVRFRNSMHDTFVAITYVNRRITVLSNIHGTSDWEHCFVVPNVDLPTGYYLGFSAATGDLADNHDIVAVKTYDMGGVKNGGTMAEELDWSTVVPHAKYVEPPRPHVDDIPPWFGPNAYRAISVAMLLLLAVGIVAIVGGVWFVQAQSRRKKHFF